MNKYIIFTLVFALQISTFAKDILLNKISASVNGTVISLSQIQRYLDTVKVRKAISPIIYQRDKNYSVDSMKDLLIKQTLINQKLNEFGIKIGDKEVNQQITRTLEGLKISKAQLKQFLGQNKVDYNEYFELIRNSIKFSIFYSRFIAPNVSEVNDKKIEQYYEENKGKFFTSYKYDLKGFTSPIDQLPSKSRSKYKSAVRKYLSTNQTPTDYSSISEIDLGVVAEDEIDPFIFSKIKNLGRGQYSSVISKEGNYLIFYVKRKLIKKRASFDQTKQMIKAKLQDDKSRVLIDEWFVSDFSNHIIEKY